mmetsp:Transcript_64805/g.76727  ORF Transcript_64805/g.76727 Transcript_64805/m.76727 type:complete len:115 (-) Transcript_64805:2693-3037(-)
MPVSLPSSQQRAQRDCCCRCNDDVDDGNNNKKKSVRFKLLPMCFHLIGMMRRHDDIPECYTIYTESQSSWSARTGYSAADKNELMSPPILQYDDSLEDDSIEDRDNKMMLLGHQ